MKRAEHILKDITIPMPTVFFNSEKTEKLRFEAVYTGITDGHFLIKCLPLGSIGYVDEVLVKYRRHAGNYSARSSFYQQRKRLYLWASKNFPEEKIVLNEMRRLLLFYSAKDKLLNGQIFQSLTAYFQFTIFCSKHPRNIARVAVFQFYLLSFFFSKLTSYSKKLL